MLCFYAELANCLVRPPLPYPRNGTRPASCLPERYPDCQAGAAADNPQAGDAVICRLRPTEYHRSRFAIAYLSSASHSGPGRRTPCAISSPNAAGAPLTRAGCHPDEASQGCGAPPLWGIQRMSFPCNVACAGCLGAALCFVAQKHPFIWHARPRPLRQSQRWPCAKSYG